MVGGLVIENQPSAIRRRRSAFCYRASEEPPGVRVVSHRLCYCTLLVRQQWSVNTAIALAHRHCTPLLALIPLPATVVRRKILQHKVGNILTPAFGSWSPARLLLCGIRPSFSRFPDSTRPNLFFFQWALEML